MSMMSVMGAPPRRGAGNDDDAGAESGGVFAPGGAGFDYMQMLPRGHMDQARAVMPFVLNKINQGKMDRTQTSAARGIAFERILHRTKENPILKQEVGAALILGALQVLLHPDAAEQWKKRSDRQIEYIMFGNKRYRKTALLGDGNSLEGEVWQYRLVKSEDDDDDSTNDHTDIAVKVPKWGKDDLVKEEFKFYDSIRNNLNAFSTSGVWAEFKGGTEGNGSDNNTGTNSKQSKYPDLDPKTEPMIIMKKYDCDLMHYISEKIVDCEAATQAMIALLDCIVKACAAHRVFAHADANNNIGDPFHGDLKPANICVDAIDDDTGEPKMKVVLIDPPKGKDFSLFTREYLYPLAMEKGKWKTHEGLTECVPVPEKDVRRDLWVVVYMLMEMLSAAMGARGALLYVQAATYQVLLNSHEWEWTKGDRKRTVYEQLNSIWAEFLSRMRRANANADDTAAETCKLMYMSTGLLGDDTGRPIQKLVVLFSIAVFDYVNRVAKTKGRNLKGLGDEATTFLVEVMTGLRDDKDEWRTNRSSIRDYITTFESACNSLRSELESLQSKFSADRQENDIKRNAEEMARRVAKMKPNKNPQTTTYGNRSGN